MKKMMFFVFVAVSSVLSAQTLTNDAAHSRLGFDATHLTISKVAGNFTDFTSTLTFTKEDLSDAKFTVTAKIASVNTGVEARDNHLKSADFFDAEKHAELKFVSTSFTKVIGSIYALEGDLTLHGVTKKVVLTVDYNGSVINPMSNVKTYGFTVKGTINRKDFNIGSGFPESVVGNEVVILSNLEFPVSK